jgi:hypothetical protein
MLDCQHNLALSAAGHGGTAAEFGTFIDAETEKWSKLIREAGLKGE